MTKWMRIPDAGEYFATSERTVRRMISDGRLPAHLVINLPTVRGGRPERRIDVEELERLWRKQGWGRATSPRFEIPN